MCDFNMSTDDMDQENPMTFPNTVRSLIDSGVLMSLDARDFCTNATATALIFDATILPMTKAGNRSSAPRTMTVTISVSAERDGCFDLEVTYLGRGLAKFEDPIVHYSGVALLADLNATLLALDYDGAEVLNPAYV